jgi:hypothetical protein
MGKAMVEDSRFEQLWKYVRDYRNAEAAMIGKMAIDDPGNLVGNPEYQAFRLRFAVLDDLANRAEAIDNGHRDALEGLAA